jgi:hypothetical protein
MDLKPGGLALIVGAKHLFQNIGKTCELVLLVTKDESYVAPDGVTYNHPDPACWIVIGDGLIRMADDASPEQSNWAVCHPGHLLPLDGEPEPESRTRYTSLDLKARGSRRTPIFASAKTSTLP